MESSESFHSAVDVVAFSRIEEPKPQNSRLFLHKEPEAFSLRKPPTTTTPSVGFTCGLIPTGCKKYLTVGGEEYCLGLVQLCKMSRRRVVFDQVLLKHSGFRAYKFTCCGLRISGLRLGFTCLKLRFLGQRDAAFAKIYIPRQPSIQPSESQQPYHALDPKLKSQAPKLGPKTLPRTLNSDRKLQAVARSSSSLCSER